MIFEKSKKTENEYLYFRFDGIPKKEDIDEDKIKKLLDKIFSNNYFGNDLVRIVTYLRTILVDYEEKYLRVETTTKCIHSNVLYSNGNLFSYNKSERFTVDSNNIDNINFYYAENEKSVFSFSNGIENRWRRLYKDKLKDFLATEMDYVDYLKNNTNPVVLNRDGKIIITIYNLFYGELPDLSDLGIETKLQNMLYILLECGITTKIAGDDVAFFDYGKYPESMILCDWLRKVIPLANNVKVMDSLLLEEIIKMIGEDIRNSFRNNPNKNISFERFCYVVYSKKYCFRSTIPLKKLAENLQNEYFGSFSEEELEYYFQLIKKLNKKYD